MNSELGARCFICAEPIIFYYFVRWCDSCLDKLEKSDLSREEFIKREKIK